MVNVLTELQKYNFEFDKTTNDSNSLPYDIESVRVKSNSFVTANNLNTSLKKLFFNFLFLYKNCTIGDYRVLDTRDYTLSATNLPGSGGIKAIQYTDSFLPANSDHVKNSNSAILLTNNKIKDLRYLLISTPTKFSGYLLKRDTAEYIFEATLVDTISGSITFKNITDIKSYDNDYLFLVDSGYNNIVKYDISFLKTGENIYRNRPLLQKITGGTGLLEDRNKFTSLKKIAINNNIVVAYDEGGKCFKIFDTNLTWLNTIIISKFFDFTVDSFTDIVLLDNNDLVCSDSSNLYYFTFQNNSFTLSKSHKLLQYFIDTEKIIGLNLCYSKKNILYVTTNKSVKKMWVSQLDSLIGEYYIPDLENKSVETLSAINVRWQTNSKYDENSDSVVLFGLSGYGGEFQYFNLYKDKFSLNSILNDINLNVYEENEVILNDSEYVQSWVLMKSFKKIMYNNFILAKNIVYRFVEKENITYDKIIDKAYNNSIVNFSNDFKFDDNFNIGVNEIFQAEVVNRVIDNILNFQKILLRFVINNKNRTTYLSPNPFRGDESLKSYYYFADESLLLTPMPAVLQVFDELAPGAGIQTSLGGAPYSSLEDISITDGVLT